MPAAYSEDLRIRLIEAIRAGVPAREAGRTFLVAASTAITWAKAWREGGRTSAKPMGGSSSPLEQHAAWLLRQVAEDPSVTLQVLRSRLKDQLGVSAAVSSIWRFFDRHGISFKKNRARQRAGAGRRRRGPPAMDRAAAAA
jgi:transposase